MILRNAWMTLKIKNKYFIQSLSKTIECSLGTTFRYTLCTYECYHNIFNFFNLVNLTRLLTNVFFLFCFFFYACSQGPIGLDGPKGDVVSHNITTFFFLIKKLYYFIIAYYVVSLSCCFTCPREISWRATVWIKITSFHGMMGGCRVGTITKYI